MCRGINSLLFCLVARRGEKKKVKCHLSARAETVQDWWWCHFREFHHSGEMQMSCIFPAVDKMMQPSCQHNVFWVFFFPPGPSFLQVKKNLGRWSSVLIRWMQSFSPQLLIVKHKSSNSDLVRLSDSAQLESHQGCNIYRTEQKYQTCNHLIILCSCQSATVVTEPWRHPSPCYWVLHWAQDKPVMFSLTSAFRLMLSWENDNYELRQNVTISNLQCDRPAFLTWQRWWCNRVCPEGFNPPLEGRRPDENWWQDKVFYRNCRPSFTFWVRGHKVQIPCFCA